MHAFILIILFSFLPFCASAQTSNDSIMISVNDTTTSVLPDSLQILSENGSTVNKAEVEADTIPDETEEFEEPEPVLHELPTVLDSIYNFRHSLGTLPDSVTSNATWRCSSCPKSMCLSPETENSWESRSTK